FYFRLPNSYHVLLGVVDPGERAGRNRNRTHHLLAAQRLGLGDRCRDIVNLNVEGGVMLRLVAKRNEMPRQPGLGDLIVLVDGPVEHLLIEILGGSEIAATDFEVNHGMFASHRASGTFTGAQDIARGRWRAERLDRGYG